MLLAIDVGNTNITIGIFDNENMLATFRLTTQKACTSDEYGIVLCDLIEHKNIAITQIDAVVISSVVPDIMHSLGNAVIKYFGVKPLVVSAGVKTGIQIRSDNPKQVGSDRIVDAVAAYELYGGPVLVLDFGTATTYDLIAEDGVFIAAVTSPGLRLSARALWKGAAMLPEIEIKRPKSILAKETVSSMQAGLVYGYIGQTEYIVRKMKEESGLLNAKVVATGGLGKIIVEGTDCIDVYNPKLTLEGLRLIYLKNKK